MKVFKYLATALALLIATNAQAYFHNSSYEYGGALYHYEYKEPAVMRSKGAMFGMHGATNFDYIGAESLLHESLLRLESSFYLGDLDYSSYNTGSAKSHTNDVFETRLLAGHGGILNKNLLIGIGYRKLIDHGYGMVTNTGHSGYDRTSQYTYIPIILKNDKLMRINNYDIGMSLEYDVFLRGKQWSGIGPGLNHTQDKGFGIRGSFMLTRKLDSGNKLLIEPFVEAWSIEDSNLVPFSGNITLEPRNRTFAAGLKVTVLTF